MADDDRRIEPYPNIAGSGMLTSPEKIESLMRRRAQLESMSPEKGAAFAKILKTKGATEEEVEAQLTEAEKKRRTGRFGAHRHLRKRYGRSSERARRNAVERSRARWPTSIRVLTRGRR